MRLRPVERAVVLGGSGFFGGHLVARLGEVGIRSTAIGRNGDTAAVLRDHRADVVFDLAGSGTVPESVSAPLADLDANVTTTLVALEAARWLSNPPLFVFVSSAAVYGSAQTVPMAESHPLRPMSPYGVSKLAAEHYVRLYAEMHGMSTVIVRPFSLYGPGQRKLAVYELLRRLLTGENPLRISGSPALTRDFVWIGDAAAALVQLALAAPASGEAYNLASGDETTMGDLVQHLIDIAAPHATVEFTGEVRAGDPLRWVGDPGLSAALGASCDTPLVEGLERTAEWVRTETRQPTD